MIRPEGLEIISSFRGTASLISVAVSSQRLTQIAAPRRLKSTERISRCLRRWSIFLFLDIVLNRFLAQELRCFCVMNSA